MKYLVYFFGLALVLASCVSSNEENTVVETEINEQVPNRMLSLQVEGMACEYACGGEIRKNLKALEGVSRVEVNFESEREVNGVNVYYNDTNIEVSEMIKLIEKLNDGQFRVQEQEVSDFKSEDHSMNTNSSHTSETTVNASTNSFEVPNILDLLSELIVK